MRSSAIGALAVFVCAVTAQVATARPLPPADVAVINQAVAQEMASNKLIGVTVSVQSPRGTFIRSYGKADIRTGRALQPGDHFRIASVTKTFTATAVLRLVDQRKLRLSDKLARYVPGVPNGKRITIGQVLAMRSGVFNFIDDKRFTTRYNANPLLPGWRPRDILPILRRHRPSFSPGKRTEYSDSNYELLGLVLEKVTGQPAERVLTNTVIKP